MSGSPAVAAPHSQTLSRGLRVLEILAETNRPMSIAELAIALEVHRSVAYRILRTLEDHNMVARDSAGGVQLGARLGELAQSVARDLQAAALPELTSLANDLTMTAFMAVLEGSEAVVLTSVEPRHQAATIVYRPGTRHPIALGAPGIAIQSTLNNAEWKALCPGQAMRDEVREIAELGYTTTRGEVIPGISATAVPLQVPGERAAALSVVYVDSQLTLQQVGARLMLAAKRIEESLS